MLYTSLIISTLLMAASAIYECPLNNPVITVGGCDAGVPCYRPSVNDANYLCRSIGKKYSSSQHVAKSLNDAGAPNVSLWCLNWRISMANNIRASRKLGSVAPPTEVRTGWFLSVGYFGLRPRTRQYCQGRWTQEIGTSVGMDKMETWVIPILCISL